LLHLIITLSKKPMRSILVLLLLTLALTNLKAQQNTTKNWPKEDQKKFALAKDLYNKGYYTSAFEKYTSLRATHPNDMHLKFVTGVCAIYINDKQTEAEVLLNEVKANEKDKKGIDYYLVLLYQKTYRFTKALELATTLLADTKLSEDDRADLERLAFFSKNGIKELEFPVDSKIESLGPLINSEYAE